MKKIITFIPLGIAISSALIYVFNLISFRVIGNGAALNQILSNLRIYLYISVIGFAFYFLVNLLYFIKYRKNEEKLFNKEDKKQQITEVKIPSDNEVEINQIPKALPQTSVYEPLEFENAKLVKTTIQIKEEIPKQVVVENNNVNDYDNKEKENLLKEEKYDEEYVTSDSKYCFNCGQKLFINDKYCSRCGKNQNVRTYRKNSPLLRKIINALEIVIMLLILYFSINMLFDYKEKTDSNFTSPFKISMTK